VPRVHFKPLGKSREIRSGATILAAANQVEVPIGQSCSGDGICGWCKVIIVEGEDGLMPPTPLERKLMAANKFAGNERAACLAKVKGDVTVTTTYW
jgi:adenylate cyclase